MPGTGGERRVIKFPALQSCARRKARVEHKVGAPGWAAPGAEFNLLLYSPAHDGGHIKWPPVRAELAINFISARTTGNLPKRDRFILIGFI